MTTTQLLILVGVMTVAIGLALIVINYLYKKDEKENKLCKYVLIFNKKTKLFSEQRSDEFEEQENELMVAINDHFCLHSFNRFIAEECYHITTINQAKKVFDIYLASRDCKLQANAK